MVHVSKLIKVFHNAEVGKAVDERSVPIPVQFPSKTT